MMESGLFNKPQYVLKRHGPGNDSMVKSGKMFKKRASALSILDRSGNQKLVLNGYFLCGKTKGAFCLLVCENTLRKSSKHGARFL